MVRQIMKWKMHWNDDEFDSELTELLLFLLLDDKIDHEIHDNRVRNDWNDVEFDSELFEFDWIVTY